MNDAFSLTSFQISANAILQFFIRNYGEVEYVGLHTEETHRVAFVAFREASNARRASVFTAHTIAGNVVNVTMPDTIVQSPNLLSMPDDCVRDIMRHLELKDLCSMAGVCERLRTLAKAVFGPKGKDLRLGIKSVQDVQECLRNFGPEIESMAINLCDKVQKSHHNSLLNVLVQHCSGTLTTLRIHNFTFEMNSAIIAESRPLLVGLKKLILHKCTISVKWFVHCHQLVELELIDTHVTYNGAQYQTCPNLETLKIYGSKSWVDYGLHLFLMQNEQLKTLQVLPLQTSSNRSHQSYGDILYCVPKYVDNLTIVPAEATRLDHLPWLRTLRIEGIYLNNYSATVINNVRNVSIEHLEIDLNYFGIDRQNAEAIGRLRKIKTLKLHCSGGCGSAELLDMVRNLKGLTDLVMSTHRNTLNAHNILCILEQCPNLGRLCLSFADNGEDGHKLEMNEQIYHKLLDAVLRRFTETPLCVVIVGRRHQIERINVAFRMHAALKIACLRTKEVSTILKMKKGYYLQEHIKMTDDVLDELRVRGLCY